MTCCQSWFVDQISNDSDVNDLCAWNKFCIIESFMKSINNSDTNVEIELDL
jgi:hypothetical protein